MQIFQLAGIGKKLSEIKEPTLASAPGFKRGKLRNVNHKEKPIPQNGADADDWIIGGRSLAAHCKSMRYVESSDSQFSNMPETATLSASMNEFSDVNEVLSEPVVL